MWFPHTHFNQSYEIWRIFTDIDIREILSANFKSSQQRVPQKSFPGVVWKEFNHYLSSGCLKRIWPLNAFQDTVKHYLDALDCCVDGEDLELLDDDRGDAARAVRRLSVDRLYHAAVCRAWNGIRFSIRLKRCFGEIDKMSRCIQVIMW